CNDFGSLMIEENVVSAAGTEFIMPEAEIVRLIEDADFIPKPRDQDYTLVEAEPVAAPAPVC
ncbi:MAG: dehypoxanthine futalosine cyclase, partial [Gemmatimonadota bacterium]